MTTPSGVGVVDVDADKGGPLQAVAEIGVAADPIDSQPPLAQLAVGRQVAYLYVGFAPLAEIEMLVGKVGTKTDEATTAKPSIQADGDASDPVGGTPCIAIPIELTKDPIDPRRCHQ